MRTSSLGYLIKEGAKNVFHNRLMSLASVGVLTACLILIGGATPVSYTHLDVYKRQMWSSSGPTGR